MLEKEIERNLEMTENITMKEIKGLGDRLFGLEKLMQDAKRYVSEQVKIAESFQRVSESVPSAHAPTLHLSFFRITVGRVNSRSNRCCQICVLLISTS